MSAGTSSDDPPAHHPPLRLRALVAGVYGPSLCFSIGSGAIVPALAFTALDLGASPALAGLVLAFVGIGHVLADVPAGQLVVRIGERRAMYVAVVVVIAALLLCIAAPSVWIFGAAAFLIGASEAVWHLARQLYLTELVPYERRGRALSSLGGVSRVGLFCGPLLGAAAVGVVGDDGPYWVHVVMALAAAAVLVGTRRSVPGAASGADDPSLRGLLAVVSAQRRTLLTVGVAALGVSAIRAARQVLLPLWAAHIGLDVATTSVIFAVSGAVEMTLFYPSGVAMDRLGRRRIAVIAMLVLGGAHVALPMTDSALTLAAVAIVMGIGNGLSAGLVMTIGADVSEPGTRGQFLAAFRVLADLGAVAGPLTIGALAVGGTLVPAIAAVAAIGGLTAAALHRWVPGPRTAVRTAVPATPDPRSP